ncbi:MAG: efflux RND transporter periplasmic adaptor subunit [Pseudoflavonifractor sp.]|nr:efflux RND transporter periplasmic adaptor subunit [Pseudoflavonifractor sp.]
MRYNYTLLLSAILWLVSGCAGSVKDDGLGHDHHAHHDDEHADAAGHGDEIILTPEAASRFGVKTDSVRLRPFSEVIFVSGQIVSAPTDQAVASAPSAGILRYAPNITEGTKVNAGTAIASISAKGIEGGDANAAAKAAVDAAKRELDRVTPLHADGIVSTKDYNAARQAYETALAAYSGSAVGSRVVSPISGVVTGMMVRQGEYVTAGQPVATISKSERMTLRADLPEKYYKSLPRISDARFKTSYSDTAISVSDLNGRMVSVPSAASGNQAGYLPIYFSFDNTGVAVPGTFAEIYLLGTPRHDVMAIPVSAVTEQQGAYYVYVRIDEEGYHKHRVILGDTDGKYVEVLDGLEVGDELVTDGAVVVKMAESSGTVPERHSHNH